MYTIEKKMYGLKLTFGGFIQAPEMQNWVDESGKALAGLSSGFGVFVDMRELKPLPPEAQEVMQVGQIAFKQKGMKRSVVILANAIVTMQFKRIAKETGIYEWERYIDASAHSNWEAIGEAWITKGTDPD